MPKKTLEDQIEQLRLKIYHAYHRQENQSHILHLSEELDKLLNQLDEMNKDF